MQSDSLARTCLQAAVRRRLQAPSFFFGAVFYFCPEPPPCGSARSSQWSEGEDDATYTCDGDSCEFKGTFAEVIEHENRCKQMTGKLGLPTKSADKAAAAAAAAAAGKSMLKRKMSESGEEGGGGSSMKRAAGGVGGASAAD